MAQLSEERVKAQSAELLLLVPQLAMGFKGLLAELPAEAASAGRLSPRHRAMLISLSAEGPGSVTDIATRMRLSLTHASQIVGELATSGLVERREDESDRRRTIVSIAPSSRILIEGMTTGLTGPLDDFCAALSAAEAQQFISHMTLLVSSLLAGGQPAERDMDRADTDRFTRRAG